MKNKFYLLLPLVTLFYVNAHAQVIYSNFSNPSGHYSAVRDPDLGALCLGGALCPVISNASNVADNSLNNYATVDFPVLQLVSSVTFTIDLNGTVDNNGYGGVYIKGEANVLSLEVLPIIQLELLNDNTVVASGTVAGLLDLGLFSEVGARLCIAPETETSYNKVRLKIIIPLGVNLATQFKVYYAFGGQTAPCASGALPVNFKDFNVKQASPSSVNIHWITDQESNSSHFTIERKYEGSSKWEYVARVNATGNSSTPVQYSYTDRNLLSSKVSYRIGAHDLDGKVSYFPERSVTLTAAQEGDVLVYPTVSSSSIIIQSGAEFRNSKVLVTDMNGRSFQPEITATASGYVLDVSRLPAGTYVLHLASSGGNKKAVRFIVQGKK